MSRKNKPTKPETDSGQFSYEGLDRVIHEKARLGILASLAAHEKGLRFNDLKDLCSLTDGNLSRHVAVLSEAKLVSVQKTSGETRSQTLYKLTSTGRKRFAEYIDTLESIVTSAQVDTSSKRSRTKFSPA